MNRIAINPSPLTASLALTCLGLGHLVLPLSFFWPLIFGSLLVVWFLSSRFAALDLSGAWWRVFSIYYFAGFGPAMLGSWILPHSEGEGVDLSTILLAQAFLLPWCAISAFLIVLARRERREEARQELKTQDQD